MIGTFRLGKLFGIEINVHWSWVFIFFLVTWTFADSVLDHYFPEWTSAQRWIVGAAVSLIFFSSILLHEMSHSLVARRNGIGVSSITLFIFGGVSNLNKEPDNAKQEFVIAIVGPLTSILLGAVFGAGYFVLHPIDTGAAGVSGQLALINTAIGVFNLAPGFPLDGGRVVRSIFWWRKRNLLEATRMASVAGQWVAYLLMALGVFNFLFVSSLSGVWFFLIGVFLRNASTASYEQLFVETVLKGVPATLVARQDFIAVSPDMTIAQVVDEHVLTGMARCFPVMAGEELLGLFTLTDAQRVRRDDWPTTTVYRAMTPFEKLKIVTPRDEMPAVLQLMAVADLNQIPVVEGKLLRGLIHRADVIRYIQMRRQIGAGATTS